MILSAIVAIDEKNGMGKDGGIPWHIPGEQKRFKDITTPHPMIMGRKTFVSIGRILPNRPHIIVSRDPSYKVTGTTVVDSVQQAIEIAQEIEEKAVIARVRQLAETKQSHPPFILSDSEKSQSPVIPAKAGIQSSRHPNLVSISQLPATGEIFIIGGGQIFQEAMQYIDRLYLTVIRHDFACDTFFPDYSAFTKVIEKEEKNDWEYPYAFITLEK